MEVAVVGEITDPAVPSGFHSAELCLILASGRPIDRRVSFRLRNNRGMGLEFSGGSMDMPRRGPMDNPNWPYAIDNPEPFPERTPPTFLERVDAEVGGLPEPVLPPEEGKPGYPMYHHESLERLFKFSKTEAMQAGAAERLSQLAFEQGAVRVSADYHGYAVRLAGSPRSLDVLAENAQWAAEVADVAAAKREQVNEEMRWYRRAAETLRSDDPGAAKLGIEVGDRHAKAGRKALASSHYRNAGRLASVKKDMVTVNAAKRKLAALSQPVRVL
jgi:hypothetical protein